LATNGRRNKVQKRFKNGLGGSTKKDLTTSLVRNESEIGTCPGEKLAAEAKITDQVRAITEMLKKTAIGFVHLLGGLVIDMLCVVVFS
jgi:hypothetical protein